MLESLTVLLICQLGGEVLVRLIGWPIPGPVLGMALLFAALVVRGNLPASLESAAGGLLRHLSLLFVPAGAGVMLHGALLAREWLPISVALVASTIITIVVTGLVMKLLTPRPAPGTEKQP